MIKVILKAVATGTINEQQAERMYEFWQQEQLNGAEHADQYKEEPMEKIKDIEPLTKVHDRHNRLDKMMRECYGYWIIGVTDTTSFYVLYNGSSVIDQISISRNDFSVNVTNEEWVKGYKKNLKKYGLK